MKLDSSSNENFTNCCPQIFKRNGRSIKFYLVAGPTYVTDEGGLTGRDVEDLATAIEVRLSDLIMQCFGLIALSTS